MTVFYASVLPEFLPRATALLADMMRPALRDEDFTTEKGVILEEIAMYKDEPVWVLHDALMERHFAGSALGHRVLGTTETITDLRVEQMRRYFADRYSADNTTLALAGRVDFDRAVEQAQALCGQWGATRPARDHTTPAIAGQDAFVLRDERVSRAYRMSVAPGPGSDDELRYPAFVAAQVLGGADNSRFHWALIEPGIAEEAELSVEPMDGLGLSRMMLVTEPASIDQAWDVALRQVRELAGSLTAQDVEIIRGKLATGVTVAGERPEGRMHRLGRQWLYQGRYTTLEHELQRVSEVTVAQVRAFLDQYPLLPVTTGTLLPGEGAPERTQEG
jgi:predicted Zn-dependent peptidase